MPGDEGKDTNARPVAAVFGASGGIGRSLCEVLSERGCHPIYAGSRRGVGPDARIFGVLGLI